MRYFIWVDFQYEMLALFTGAIALILTYTAWASYPKRRVPRTEEELEERGGHERQSGHDVEKNPIAPFLIYIYVFIAVWSVSYMIYIWTTQSRF